MKESHTVKQQPKQGITIPKDDAKDKPRQIADSPAPWSSAGKKEIPAPRLTHYPVIQEGC
jgi:hypothetical protein